MGKKILNYKILILFLLMSITIFGKLKVKKIDLSGYPRIILTLNGNNNGREVLEFKENNGDYIKDLSVYNKRKIAYTSTLNLNPREEVTIKFFVNWNRVTYKYNVPEKPKSIEIKTYEDIHGWKIGYRTTTKDSNIEYVFTKGGLGSYVEYPVIYVVVPKDKKIKKLKIEMLDSNGKVIETKRKIIKPKETGNIEIESNYFNFIENGAYRVKITPISKGKNRRDIEGDPKFLNFIVDTKIKNSYLEKEDIISELEVEDEKPIIKIKLSKFEELSGIYKYSYTLSNGFQKQNKTILVEGEKSLIPDKDANLDDVKIPLGDFSEGSRLTLSFEVYDRVGNKKTYEKTYFRSKEVSRITAKVSGDVKQRNSRIKIVTEGNKDKFGIGSNIDESSEDETNISGS